MPLTTFEELASLMHLDFLIIGGGTAGLVVAARLSEDPDFTVVVVEAGAYHGAVPEIDVPGYMGRLIGNPKYDWCFSSVPQPRAHNRVVSQARGKGLGGCSLLHFMGMFRPSKAEMDALAELGVEGWDWESMLYYMKKSETLQPSAITNADALKYAADPNPEYHGSNGPIQKSFGIGMGDLHAKLFDTVQNLGIHRNPDTGAGRNDGFMTSMLSIDSTTAKRSHSASAYLEPNLSRKNLLVLTEAQVTKILFRSDGSLQRAVGVEMIKDGVDVRLENVRLEVLLAAGSFQTPQLLELSGIGNPDISSKYGIETLIDLPGVGENLQDHLGLTTMVEVETTDMTTDDLSDPAVVHAQEELYKQGKGLFASVAAQAFAFLPAHALGTPEEIASWQDHFHTQCTETLAKAHPFLRSGLEKQYKIHQRLFADQDQAQAELLLYLGRQRMPNAPPPEPGKRYLSLVCALSRPLSRGSVHIISPDPLTPPAIDPNYFANDADLELFVRVLQYALEVERTAPLAQAVKAPVMPTREMLDKGKEGLVEYVKAYCRQVYHPVGTASMMPRADGGVVDSRLKVYGASNLRVVDLSILPMEFACHTQSLAYAIAEKAADMIKSDHLGADLDLNDSKT